jgi:thiol:disulfide interchange protein DsbD
MLRSFFAVMLGAALLAHSAMSTAGGFFTDQASQTPDFLPADEAFVLDAIALDHAHIEARWLIAPGYYLYKHRLQVQGLSPADLPVDWEAPQGEAHEDEHFGPVEIYHDELSLPIQIATQAQTVTMKISYQGCAEAGLCYPPRSRIFMLDIPAAP